MATISEERTLHVDDERSETKDRSIRRHKNSNVSLSNRKSVFDRLGGTSSRDDRSSRTLGKRDANYRCDDRMEKRHRVDSENGSTGRVVEERKKRAIAPGTRRMFGALMGHLGKAKAMIEHDSSLMERQKTMQLEAERKEKEMSKELESKARREAMIRKLEKLIVQTEKDQNDRVTQMTQKHELDLSTSEAHSRLLVTTAFPPIYYLPKKHTKETEDLIASSIEAHSEKVVTAAREFEIKLREVKASFVVKIDKLKQQLGELKQEEELIKVPEKQNNVQDTEEDESKMDRIDQEGEDKINSSPHSDEAVKDEVADLRSSPSITGSPKKDRIDSISSPRETKSNQVASDDVPASPMPIPSRVDHLSKQNKAVQSPVKEAKVVQSPVKEVKVVQSPVKNDKVENIIMSPPKPVVDQPITVNSPPKSAVDQPITVITPTKTPPSTQTVTPLKTPAPTQPVTPQDVTGKESLSQVTPDPDSSFTTPQKQIITVSKLKVTELREELKKRGLDTKGLKAALIQRLEEAINES